MEQTEAMETSVEMTESFPEVRTEIQASEGGWPEGLLAEAEELREIYPHFDLASEMEHPVMGVLLRGEEKPTLRQLYEAVHMEDILEGRVSSAVEAQISRAVESAVAEAVSAAVRDCEERLLGHIRARGQRPSENGLNAATGIRMHPAVDRLTRRERAMLAKRAENGETVQL
ncbi:MAG: hypothetical protein IJA91_05155 [Clostridia bacterium]|nr:hypothetical protein [Clostridia bacterium]